MEPTTGKIAWELGKTLLKSKKGRKFVAWVLAALILAAGASAAAPFAALMMVSMAGSNQGQLNAAAVAQDEEAQVDCATDTTSLGGGAVATGSIAQQQVTNAKAIDSVVQKLGLSGRASLIALTTAVGESDLINIDYGDARNGVRNPDGSLTTSFGLFQQQESMGWGTKAQIMNPAFATESFLKGRGGNKGLLSVSGWETGDISTVIHTVQRNANPNHYTKFVGRARAIAERAGIDLNRGGTSANPAAVLTSTNVVRCGTTASGNPIVLGGKTTLNITTNGPCPLGKANTGADCNRAISYSLQQMNSGSRAWKRWCLRLVSESYGSVYAGIPTAYQGGLLMERRGLMQKPPKDYAQIPRGAVLWYDGRATGNTAGHVAISLGGGKAISNDVPVNDGRVGIVDIAYFETNWGQRFMGWSAPQR